MDCYSPRKVRVLWVLLLGTFAALLWAVWVYAPAQSEASASRWEAKRLDLMKQLAASRAERSKHASDAVKFARIEEVNERAYATLQQDFDGLQRQILRLREELAFYQAVTAPDTNGAGVRVQRFQLKSDGTADGFLYTLVLMQSKESKKIVTGTVRFRIRGSRNGKQADLELRDLSDAPVTELKLQFRYFQDLSGSIKLPRGFLPERVNLEIKLKGSRRVIKESYAWSQLQT